MAKNESFSLDPHQDREAGLAALREALEDGERSGEPTEFDFPRFLARLRGFGIVQLVQLAGRTLWATLDPSGSPLPAPCGVCAHDGRYG